MDLAIDVFRTQVFPPISTFSVGDIPDLTGKVAAVTGGYGGVGYETVKALLNHNATVIILGRSESKAKEAMARLEEESGEKGELLFVMLDLEDLPTVRRASEEIASKFSSLDILFCNAGVMAPPANSRNKHGHDLEFGCNVLAHWFLSTLLLPLLLASPNKAEGFPRVVHTSSSAHLFAPTGGIDFDSVKAEDGMERPRSSLAKHVLYGQSKLGNIIIANELHRRYASQGLVSSAAHPGNLNTQLQRHGSWVQRAILHFFFYPASQGALTQLYTGTTVEGKDFGGRYLVPWARIGRCRPEAADLELGSKLWEWCERKCAEF